MKKRKMIVTAVLAAAMLLAACGKEDKPETDSLFESTETGTATGQDEAVGKDAAKQEAKPATDNKTEAITEDQAYNAVINYCKANNPDFDETGNAEGYTEYWDVSTDENGKIVVLYRSYTGAQIRYYVDPVSGETYVTELVPGIIDEEQKNGETFNARDYLNANSQKAPSSDASKADTADAVMNDGSDAFYDALDPFYGEYSYKDSSDGLEGTLYIIQEFDNSREYSIYESNTNGFRFIALGSNIEYIKGNRFFMKYPETVYEDDTAVFKYYIAEKTGNDVSLYESDENYEKSEFLYTAHLN